MAAATIDMVNKSVEAFIKKLLIAEEVSHNDDVVDALFEEIVNDLWILKKMRGLPVLDMLMVAKYFERIGDHAVNIASGCSSLLQANIKDYNLFSVFPFSPITVYI